jgi:pimeloyl-ACP methyl ester carboxylesterase
MRKQRNIKVILGILLGLVLLFACIFLILNVEKLDLTNAVRDDAEGDFVELSAGLVHYQIEGPEDATLVVLVRGFSVPAYVWDPTFQALKRAGYRVLSFDLYGRGYSDRPDVEYDIDLFANQVEELLLGLGIEDPVHLIGLSMGGPIVARYANSHPDLVRGITLIAPEVVQISWKDIFPLNLPGVGEYLMAAVMEPVVLPWLQTSDFYQPEKFPGWEEKYRDQLQYRGTGRALLSTIRNLVNLDPELEYQKLYETKMPVLLI